MTAEQMLNILRNLKDSAKYIDEHRYDIFANYRNVAEHEIDDMIDTLKNLDLDDDVKDEDMLPSNCLYIKGYLVRNHDGIPSVKENKDDYGTDSIIDQIESYADTNGFTREKSTGLGGTQTFIRNCNMRAFFTKKECSLIAAQHALDTFMYGGDLATDTSYTGYSEWTITGMDLDEFTIGGHDLKNELDSHMGEYIHLIIECE